MTPYEMFAALDALDGDARICYSPYSRQVYLTLPHLEIGDGYVLRGPTEHRDTFEEAIRAYWTCVTDLALGEYLVLHSMDPARRKHVRWNGYMWQDLAYAPPRAIAEHPAAP